MAKIVPIEDCKAKDPNTCRYHGAQIRMLHAQHIGDFEAYFQERTTLETLQKKGWKEKYKTHRLFGKENNNDERLTKAEQKARELDKYYYEHQVAIKNLQLNYGVLKEFQLASEDYVALGPLEHRNYDSSPYARWILKQDENGDWQNLTYGKYYTFQLETRITDAKEAIVTFMLNDKAKEIQEKRRVEGS